MPYADGKIYRTATEGVSIGDIASALRASTGDLGTLCKSPLINKWAKYKPVNIDSVAILTESQRSDVNYGMGNIPYYLRVATMLADIKNNTFANAANIATLDLRFDAWIHIVPTTKYRVLDFDGYNSNAIAPIDRATGANFVRAADGKTVISWTGYSEPSADYLLLEDIHIGTRQFGDLYPTLCIYNESTQIYVTQMENYDDPATAIMVSQLVNYGVFFRTTKIPVGTYSAFVFLSDHIFNGETTYAQNGYFVPVNFTGCAFDISQAVRQITITVAAFRDSVTAPISGQFIITNGDNTQYQLTDIVVDFINAGGTTLYSTTVMPSPTLGALQTINSGISVWATATIVSRYALRNATDVRLSFRIGTTTYTQTARITIGPPRD